MNPRPSLIQKPWSQQSACAALTRVGHQQLSATLLTSMKMFRLFLVLLVNLSAALSLGRAADQSGPVYELRTYVATPGNTAALLTRFREHTIRIFEKHGMKNIG